MHAIQAAQSQDGSDWRRFCHNDLYSVNFLDDGSVRMVDWEFAIGVPLSVTGKSIYFDR